MFSPRCIPASLTRFSHLFSIKYRHAVLSERIKSSYLTLACSKSAKKTRTRCEIYSKLKIKTRCQCHGSAVFIVSFWTFGVFIVNLEDILHLLLVFLLLTLSKWIFAFIIFIYLFIYSFIYLSIYLFIYVLFCCTSRKTKI